MEYIQNFKFKDLFITGKEYNEKLKQKPLHELHWWEKLYLWYYKNFNYVLLVCVIILLISIIKYVSIEKLNKLNKRATKTLKGGGVKTPNYKSLGKIFKKKSSKSETSETSENEDTSEKSPVSNYYKFIVSLSITFAIGIFIFPTIILIYIGFLTFLLSKKHYTRLFTM
jgi:hypothetical protein